MADRGSSIDEQKVDYTISIVNEHPQEAKESLAELDRDIICHTMSGKPIKSLGVTNGRFAMAKSLCAMMPHVSFCGKRVNS